MAKPKMTIDELNKMYGINGKDKPKSPKSSTGKQSKSSALSIDDLNRMYGVGKNSDKSRTTLTPFNRIGILPTLRGGGKATASTPANSELPTVSSMAELSAMGLSVADYLNNKNTTFEGQSNEAYSQAVHNATSKTVLTSNLSKEERNKRIKEIDGELRTLHTSLSGIERARSYGGSNEWYENKKKEINDKISKLSEERKSLERVGTFSAEELKEFEIKDAKAEKAKLPVNNPTARVSPSQVDEYVANLKAHNEVDKKIELLENQKELYHNITEYADTVNADTFGGQWRANYRSNALSRMADKAMGEYLSNPTEENKQIAYAYDVLSKRYMANNAEALDDKNVQLGFLTKNIAGYLPQFKDQIIPELVGGGMGGVLGWGVGNPQLGASIGAGMASYATSYPVIQGQVYRALLAEGVDEETARQAAEDEALVSSLIEGGETAISWLFSGGGKALGAIKSAAKASVAKGSTNVATKFIAKMATKSTAKAATKAVAKNSLWKTGLNIVGDVAKQGATEYAEEFLQQGVSIANKDRVLNGRVDDSLVLGTGKVLKDAFTGNNPEALSEMHEAGKTGFTIGVMMGGSRTTVNNIITHYANAKTVKAQNEFADAIINDEESLDALIKEGKASGKGTVSAKIATEVEQAKSKGEVTREQVKKLIVSNDVYIKEEERATAELTKATSKVAGTDTKPSSTPLHERLNALSQANETIDIEDVKKASGFGENGAKLLTAVASQDGMTFPKARDAMMVAYMSGYNGENINFSNDLQNKAMQAGIDDRIIDNEIALEKARNATVYKGAFTENEYTAKLTPETRKMVARIAKDFGMSIKVVDKIIANKVTGREANASHIDGKMQISSNKSVEKLIHALIMHESGHRMEQFATKEWNALASVLYERAERLGRRAKLGVSKGMAFDRMKAAHDEAGITKSTSGYYGEVVMEELETIFSSEEEFNKFIDEIKSNKEAKSALRKVIDFITELIKKVKKFIAELKMTDAEYIAAIDTLAELEHIKELYAKAYLATEKAVAEKRAETKKSEKKAETEGDVNFSLVGVREDGIEVYKTSKEVMNMPVKDRKKLYLRLMKKVYSGRTARFVRNGHTYYAEFDKKDLRKSIYGDSRSSEDGLKALTRVGADGNVFDLVENSKYDHSSPDKKNHNKTDYFDYFIKTVQIDDKVYDLLADVKKQYGKDGGYVYTIVLTDNKKIKVAPTEASQIDALKVVETTLNDNNRLSQNPKSVKRNFSLKEKAPTFYSHMGKTIDEMKQDKIGANSVVSYLKGRGVKDEEIKWSGVETFLEGKKSVTKAELQEFVAGSMLQIEEEVVVPKWGEYKLEGGDNYREITFKMPNSSYSNNMMKTHWGETAKGILAHARIQDFDVDSGKMLFVEEIQSDWHNEGQRVGYDGIAKNKDLSDARKRYRELEKEKNEIWERLKSQNASVISAEEKESLVNAVMSRDKEITDELDALKKKFGIDVTSLIDDVPDAPFRNTYHEYVLKRLIRMAAEEGYDSIGWTTADIQSERWSENFAEGYRIEYDQEIPKFLNKYGKKWGAKVDKTSLEDVGVTEYTISLEEGEIGDGSVYHSEEEAIAGLVGYVNNTWGTDYEIDNATVASSFGDGLVIEDEMSGDEIGYIIVNETGGSATVWSMPITDSMKESVLYEGQPQYSLKDSDYLKAVENNDMGTAQKMVDEVAKSKGYTIRAYHGTSRGDRVGNVFLPERATSGPMAFFTDNREIAEGYSKSKPDTSMAYDPDYDSYETQFRIKMENMDIPLYRAWGYLPFDARNRITQKAQQLREDWDGDGGLILDPNTKEANGGFQWQLKMARGNTLLALNEQWLNSGILFNEESSYLEVLEMAGVMEEFKKIGEIYFKDPNARHEKVYDTYLRITKPFDTSYADDSFVDGLLAWYEEQDETQYERENMESDLWDKNGIDAYEFADRVRSDIENGTFHAWTSIPDSVTDYLKSLGYDGIKDLGGKNSDVGHTVWIPFSSEQIKSSEPVTYDDKGNVIPLSERFNKQSNDIRYSLKDIKDKYADKTDHLYIYEKANAISIDNMVVKKEYRNQGVGTAILSDVIDYADRVRKTITLTPTSEFGTKERLKKWYKANGFVENKGRKTDFTISDTMYRLPSDVNFSLKNTNNTDTKDRKELLDIIEHLKGEFEVTKFAKADPKKLSKLTKDLLKEYNSKADYDETYKAIDELYKYMANGEDGNTAVWDEVYNRAYKVAQNIVENSLVVDDEMYQHYKSLRDYLRTTPMKFDTRYDSVPSSYENFNEFRKLNMGRLKFTNDGRGIDSVYQELAGLYPEFFNEEEQNNASYQLERIIEVLDELQPTQINPFDRQISQVSMQLANDLTSRFFDLPQAKSTFADKAERRVVAERIKSGKKVEAVREKNKERIKKLIESQKEKTKKQLDKIREQRDTKVEKEKAKSREALAKKSESQKAKELRAKITRHAGELKKTLLKATDKKHIPAELENAVLALLYNINMESNYTYDVETNSYKKNDKGVPTNKTKAFLALKEVYADIAKNNDYGLTLASELVDTTGDGVANIFDEVMKLSDKKIADMTSEELTKIYDAIRIIEHSIKTANKMFAIQRWEDLTKTAKAFELSVATRRPKHAMMKSHLTLDIETPLTFFSHFGVAGEELYKALRNAQDNEQRMIDELADRIQGIVSSEQVKKAEKEYFTFTTVEGKELTLSKAHIMDMYLLAKRKQGLKHLLYDPDSKHFGNGIHQPEIKGKHIRRDSESTRLTKADLGEIFSKLDASDKAIADKMQKATLLLAKWGNKASMDVFGYEKFNDPDYWTIKSASESINQTPEKNKDIARSIKNMGSAKSIEEKAANAVDIGGIFNVFNQHASDMICYSAWLGVMEDATKLYNYTFRDAEGNKTNRTFQSMLEKYAGEGGKKYYFNLLKDIQNGISAPPDTATEGIYTKLYGTAAKAAVAFKATVVVQQPMSIVRATNTINPLSILQATVKGGVNLPVWAVSKVKNIVPGQSGQLLSEWYGGWQKALKYSPIASRKAIGGYEINSNSSGLKGVLYNPDTIRGKTVDALKESPLWAAGKADELTWGLLWNACEIETRRKNKALEKGSEAYYEAVNELFTKVINETQVVDGVLQRSQLMRSSSGWIKPATSFTGEPTQALNAVIRAYDNLRYETNPAKRGKKIRAFGRATTVFLMSAVFTAFARSLAVGLTGEDEEEYWDKVWKSFSGIQGDEETWFDYVKNIVLKSDAVNNVNPFTWLPISREIMSMLEGYDVERLDVGSLSKFVKEAEKFIESFGEEGKYTVGYSLRNLLLKTAEFTGYSPYNLIKDLEGVIRTAKRETEDYKGLYEMEKKRTKPANNTSAYIDILYKAYSADSKDYEYIYEDLVKEIKEGLLEKGIELTEDDKKDGKTVEMVAQEKAEETIESGMETRMKKAEGVEKSSELTKRYMSPETEDKYDSALKKVKSSNVWKSANASQRKEAEAALYDFVTSTSETWEKTRAEAKALGVDETEYTLYQLAIEMADEPKGQEGNGRYSYAEKADAINSLNLGDREIAYFVGKGASESVKEEVNEALELGIDMEEYVNFKAFVSETEADKNAKGNSIPNSKKNKVVKYLNNANLTDEEWEYFYYEIMNYKK